MLNQVTLIGRLTREPEVKSVGEKQTSLVRFSLAVSRPKYGDAEAQTDFIPVSAWRGTADFVGRNFHKGKQVYVSGRLQTNTWEDENGKKHHGFEVVAREVGFADSVQKQSGQANTNANTAPPVSDGFAGGEDFSDMENSLPEGFDVFGDGSEDEWPF